MKEKVVLQVPKGIRYISDYEKQGFRLEDFPYILDKKIPGCGFTSWILTNSQNIILASPRKMLMENKERQINGEGKDRQELVYLVQTAFYDYNVDKDLNKYSGVTKDDTQVPTDWVELKHEISKYVLQCQFDNRPIKIIVTYDSYRKVKEVLEDMGFFDTFHTVVDEFQSIFTDSRFKSSTEMEFVEVLKGVQKVCYVSATPMMEEYLDMMDYFKDLPYQELDWGTLDPGRIKKPDIDVRSLKSVNTAIKPVIESYRAGKFEHKLVYDYLTQSMRDVESKEAVIYVNSVTNIIGIIRACGLMPDEVCILCSDTPNNQKRISKKLDKKRQGIEYKIEKVPTRDETRKMFTFCTRTVYLGADFYSDNARTFIVSDANIDTLAVDITLDLPQIMGRQRLEENPWKDEAILYVRPLVKSKVISAEEFRAWIKKKVDETNDLLDSYSTSPSEKTKASLINVYSREVNGNNYRYNYVSINQHAGSKPVPAFNSLVLIAEKRAFDIQQLDYKDRFTVFNKLLDQCNITQSQSMEVQLFIQKFNSIPTVERLKFLCTSEESFTAEEWEYIFSEIPNFYRNIYLGLGPERCKALGYNYSRAKADYETKFFDISIIRDNILSNFSVGDKVSNSEVKERLKKIYENVGYKKTPKASVLGDFFEIKSIKIKEGDSWVNGIEILKLK